MRRPQRGAAGAKVATIGSKARQMNGKNPRARLQTAGFEAVAERIQPLSSNVAPSEAFQQEMRLRLLELAAPSRPRPAKRAA